jgi:uncharacterized membrane protein
MQHLIISYFTIFPKEWAVFFLSMIPITELRATIPLAITQLGMSPWLAFFYAVIGNTLMGALVVIIAEPITKLIINKIDFLRQFWEKYINRITTKNRDKFEKWGALALITFIAIPLPMTGAFTGAVAASIFQVPFKKAVPVIFAGCIIAGLIVTGLTLWVGKII